MMRRKKSLMLILLIAIFTISLAISGFTTFAEKAETANLKLTWTEHNVFGTLDAIDLSGGKTLTWLMDVTASSGLPQGGGQQWGFILADQSIDPSQEFLYLQKGSLYMYARGDWDENNYTGKGLDDSDPTFPRRGTMQSTRYLSSGTSVKIEYTPAFNGVNGKFVAYTKDIGEDDSAFIEALYMENITDSYISSSVRFFLWVGYPGNTSLTLKNLSVKDSDGVYYTNLGSRPGSTSLKITNPNDPVNYNLKWKDYNVFGTLDAMDLSGGKTITMQMDVVSSSNLPDGGGQQWGFILADQSINPQDHYLYNFKGSLYMYARGWDEWQQTGLGLDGSIPDFTGRGSLLSTKYFSQGTSVKVEYTPAFGGALGKFAIYTKAVTEDDSNFVESFFLEGITEDYISSKCRLFIWASYANNLSLTLNDFIVKDNTGNVYSNIGARPGSTTLIISDSNESFEPPIPDEEPEDLYPAPQDAMDIFSNEIYNLSWSEANVFGTLDAMDLTGGKSVTMKMDILDVTGLPDASNEQWGFILVSKDVNPALNYIFVKNIQDTCGKYGAIYMYARSDWAEAHYSATKRNGIDYNSDNDKEPMERTGSLYVNNYLKAGTSIKIEYIPAYNNVDGVFSVYTKDITASDDEYVLGFRLSGIDESRVSPRCRLYLFAPQSGLSLTVNNVSVTDNEGIAYTKLGGRHDSTTLDINNLNTVNVENGLLESNKSTGYYKDGTKITVTATIPQGYAFDYWSINGENVSTEATYLYEVNGDALLKANFKKLITLSVVSGTILNGGTTGYYNSSTEVTIIAEDAKTGYEFTGWSDGDTIVSTNMSYTFTVNNDITLIAQYKALNYSITINNGTGKTEKTLSYGSKYTLTADSIAKKSFKGWSADGTVIVSNLASYEITVTENASYTALYNNMYTVSLVGGNFNDASGLFVKDIIEGTEITINTNIIPNGKRFVGWKNGNETVSTATLYTFTVNEDITLSAFTLNVYTVKVVNGTFSDGSISKTVDEGTELNIIATVPEGKKFTNWKNGDEVISTNANHTFTVDGTLTLTAYFEDSEKNGCGCNSMTNFNNGLIIVSSMLSLFVLNLIIKRKKD